MNPFDVVELQKELKHVLPLPVDLALRKLTKRDLSTKLKGLEELSTFLTVSDELSGLKGAFEERFMQCFNKGMVDPERRVRLFYAQILELIYEKDKRLLHKGILYAWLGGTFDPYNAITSITKALPMPPLLAGVLGKEAVEWIEFRSEQLYEAYEKDAANVQDEHEKREMLALGKLAKELCLARAINIIALLGTEYSLPIAFDYSKQSSTTVRRALLYYYTKKGLMVKDVEREKAPEVLPAVFKYLAAIKQRMNEELCVNALTSGLTENSDFMKLIESPEWLWSCVQKIKFLYDERKIKLILSLLIKLFAENLDELFVRTVIESPNPFGLLEAPQCLDLFPKDVTRQFVLASLQNEDFKNERVIDVINSSSIKLPEGFKVTLLMAQKIPKLRQKYLLDLAEINESALELVKDKNDFDIIFPKAMDSMLFPILIDRFCHFMNKEQTTKFSISLPKGLKHAVWQKALEVENVHAAVASFEEFSVEDTIPESLFSNPAFCAKIFEWGLEHNNFALFEHFEAEFVVRCVLPLIEKLDVQEYLQVCNSLSVSLENYYDDFVPYSLPLMPSHVLKSNTEPKCFIDAVLKFLIRTYKLYLQTQGVEIAIRFMNDYFEEFPNEKYPLFLLDVTTSKQQLIDDTDLMKLSSKQGHYCSLLLLERNCEISDSDDLDIHEHHRIVCKALKIRKSGLQAFRDAEATSEWLTALVLSQMPVTSDILHNLILQDDQHFLLLLLPRAKVSAEFWESTLEYFEKILVENLEKNTRTVCQAVRKVQAIQTDPVLSSIKQIFSNDIVINSICDCMRIYYLGKQGEVTNELISGLLACKDVSVLKLARFLLFLQQDAILSKECINENPIIKSLISSSGDLFLRCDMLLGLAESCKGAGTNPQLEGNNFNDLGQVFSEYFFDHISTTTAAAVQDDFVGFDVDSYFPKQSEKQAFAMNLLYRSLRLYPSLYRNYSDKLPPVVEKSICPAIIKRQLEKLRLKPKELSVSSSSTMIKVMCDYSFEDALLKLELVIPPNFPLQCPEVRLPTQSNISGSRARTALLAAHSIFLSNDGADIGKAVDNWRRTLDASFSGTEACAVCYCVMCPADRSLPGPTCKTCKHKFHAACLYKWFKTSSNSTCPMCRTLF